MHLLSWLAAGDALPQPCSAELCCCCCWHLTLMVLLTLLQLVSAAAVGCHGLFDRLAGLLVCWPVPQLMLLAAVPRHLQDRHHSRV